MKTVLFICLFVVALVFTGCENNEPEAAVLVTEEVKNVTAISAESGGKIIEEGKHEALSRGICWSKIQNPTLSDSVSMDTEGLSSFSHTILHLNAKQTYYVRAFVITSQDTLYGNQVEFTTPDYILFNPELEYGTVTDIEGNVYKTITIGTQTWMAENLKVTRFRNGEVVANETDLNKWGHFQMTTSAYCWYNNDISNKQVYGALYNWYAASDPRNLAPEGWHVSSEEDWQTLAQYLGGGISPFYYADGNRLKETSTAHWRQVDFNRLASNNTGFTALPGGKVASPPFGFMDLGYGWAYFWTSTGTWDGSTCCYVGTSISLDALEPNCRGFSVRCVKD